MNRAHRTAVTVALTFAATLALSPLAMAADGEGLYGRTDDQVVTFFAFGVIIFFAAFVVIMSYLQHRLDSRKERVREDIERLRKP